MAERYKRRKRNFLINKELQGKFALLYLLLAIVGLIFIGIFFAASSYDHLTISYDNHTVEVGSTPSVLFGELLRSEGLFLLFGGLLIIIITIVLTHRIAGPLYRFEQTLKAMGENRLDQRIYLRRGDEGQALGQLINDFNQKTSDNLQRLKTIAEGLPDGQEKTDILAILDGYHLLEQTDDNS